MAQLTTLQLLATAPGGTDFSTTVSNANPNATDAALDAFAKALNSLTQNTYIDTIRIDKTSLNDSTAEEEDDDDD